ncbi:MAG: hypothetical protein G01um101466_691 [Parcubacteria group bacterium Gr01-1014_66]|nr:MAG: hypothetical protein G01um101466_691 [Parcubacteria group bacterium Gr01-1014_66]
MTISISSILQPSKKKRGKTDFHHALILGATLLFVALLVLLPHLRSLLLPAEEQQSVRVTPSDAKQPIFSWSGHITRIEENRIAIEDTNDPDQQTKTAEITEGTRITKLVFAPVFRKGEKRFIPEDSPIPPTQLKKGMQVEAYAPMDITDHDTFPSVHIRILP